MTQPFVHATAFVDDDVLLGAGTKLWHFVHVGRGARLGERCVLGQNVFVAPGVVIGNGVKIQNNVSVYAGVEIADDAFLGPSCVFTNVINPRAHIERKDEFRRTHVGRGATVGANATIVCGNDLGAYCMVGAGSVVTHTVPEHALVVGNPARLRGWACRCGDLLRETGPVTCSRCGDIYDVRAKQCTRRDKK